MKPLRIDFVKSNSCSFCNRPLKTRIAVIINDGINELQSGPVCAKKRFGSQVKNIPDLTKAATFIENSEETNQYSREHTGNNIQQNDETTQEIEYLLLRCEKLNDFKNIHYAPLNTLYDRWSSGQLSNSDVRYIRNIMEKNSSTHPQWSYRNLMACYAARYIIHLWNEHEAINDFPISLLSFLKDRYYLTEKQIDAANKWIANIPDVPLINAKWFFKIA